MSNPFKRKTVASVVAFLTNALEDLNTVAAHHHNTACQHDDLATVHKAEAQTQRAEANRASAIASNLRKLLA